MLRRPPHEAPAGGSAAPGSLGLGCSGLGTARAACVWVPLTAPRAAALPALSAAAWPPPLATPPQVAAESNTAGATYPDQSLYPVNSVPVLVKRINNVSGVLL